MKKKLILSVLLLPCLAISTSCVSKSQEIAKQQLSNTSASNTESYIFSNIALNIFDITLYDAIGGITNTSLEIVNLDKFKSYGIYLSLGKVSIDYDKEQVHIEVLYRTKENKEKKAIIITKSFFDFRAVNSNEWRGIFEGIAQFSLIEIIGKDANNNWKVNIKNQYATASDIIISPFDGNTPPADKISYKLTITNSSKVSGQLNDITSKIYLSGGRTVNKKEYGIIFRGHGSDFWTRVTKEGNIFYPNDITPTKPNHIFIGWSTNKDATMPNLFIEGRTKESFEKATDVYAVFEKYSASLFIQNSNNQKASIRLNKNGIINKSDLLEFIEANKPQPADKWSFEEDGLSFIDTDNNQIKIEFDENDNVAHKFELGNEYELKIEWNHKPFILFIDSESNEVLTTLYLDSSQNEEGETIWSTPKFSFDLAKLEKQGKYKTNLVFEQDEAIYTENQVIEVANENNWERRVLVKFKTTKEILVEQKDLEDKFKSSIPRIYTNLEGKIKQEDLPNVTFAWFKGKSERLVSEADRSNNPAFDRRSKEEKEKGVEFDGWYYDQKLTDKVYFKNGISTKALKNNKLYPKFKLSYWDKIRDIRESMDVVFSLLQNSAQVASAFEKVAEYGYYAEKIIAILKWITYLAMGGQMKQNDFWIGYENFNNLAKRFYDIKHVKATSNNSEEGGKSIFSFKYLFKDGHSQMFNTFLYFMEEVAKIFTGVYINNSNSEFKGSIFSDKNMWKIEDSFNNERNSHETRIKHARHAILNLVFKVVGDNNNFDDNIWTQKTSSNSGQQQSGNKVSDLKKKLFWKIIQEAEKIPGKGGAQYLWDISDGLVGKHSLFSVLIDIIKLIQNKDKKSPLVWTSDVVRISSTLTTSLVKIITNWQKITKTKSSS